MAINKTKVRNIDLLSAEEFAATLVRKVFPDAGIDRSNICECLAFLHVEDVINLEEQTYICYANEIPLALMIKIAMIAYGLFPYPPLRYYHPDIKCDCYTANAEPSIWAWEAACEINLVSSDMDPNAAAVKPQLREILRKLEEGDHKRIPKPFFAHWDLLPENTTRRTWEWRNGVILGLKQIPGVYLDMFRDMGWTFTYDSFQVAENYSTYAYHYVGLCSYKNRKVHINTATPSTTVHELGHFIIHAMESRNEQQELFEKEGNAAFPYLKKYARTNSYEYFAVFWATWICNPSKRLTLQTAAPKTANFVKAILEC